MYYSDDEEDTEKMSEESKSVSLASGKLRIPKTRKIKSSIASRNKKMFENGHLYHINGISLNSDGEHFITSDELRINLWNLNVTNKVFSLIDIKPDSINELNEVITSSEFHPSDGNMLIYSSSKACINLLDLRINSSFLNSTSTFQIDTPEHKKNFFTDILNSISDARFSDHGPFIYSRDYLAIRIWDLRNSKSPLSVIRVCDYLEKKLCDLYENESIFDKFPIATSPDSKYIMTGAYDSFHVIDRNSRCNVEIPAQFYPDNYPKVGKVRYYGEVKNIEEVSEEINFTKPILRYAWDPKLNTLAVSNHNCLFVYHSEKES